MGGAARTHDAVTAEPRLCLVSECGGGLGEGGEGGWAHWRMGALAHAAFARGADAALKADPGWFMGVERGGRQGEGA